MKRPKQVKETDWLKYQIGVESIGLLSMLARQVDKQKAHTVKGMMKFLDLKGDILKMQTSAYLFPLKNKINVFGKDFIKECIYFAILFSDMKLDYDILKEFGITKPKSIEHILEETK